MTFDFSKDLVFNLAGSILPNNGEVPVFLRPSPAYIPYIENRSWYIREANVHEPRYTNDGSLLLEPGSHNLIQNGTFLNQSPWKKGSLVTITPDAALGLTKNYDADVISSGASLGSPLSGVLYQEIDLSPGVYVLSVYISKVAGQYTSDDRISVIDGDILDVNSNVNTDELAGSALTNYWGTDKPFSNDNKKWKRIVQTFTVGAGTTSSLGANFQRINTNSSINDLSSAVTNNTSAFKRVVVAFFFNGGTSTSAIAGVQLEKRSTPTSFMKSSGGRAGRAGDSLIYPLNPLTTKIRNGINDPTAYDWTLRFTLKSYEGQGNIFTAGNLRVDIVRGKLFVQYQGNQIISPFALARDTQIVIRHKNNHSLRLYVDYLLRAQIKLNSIIVPREDVLRFGANTPVAIKDFYIFGTAIEDDIPLDPIVRRNASGGIFLGEKIPGPLNSLFQMDFELPVSESKGRLVFEPIILGPEKTAFIRFPNVRRYSEPINSCTPALGSGAQQITVELLPVKQYPNDSAFIYSVTVQGKAVFARTTQTPPNVTTLNNLCTSLANQINAFTNEVSAASIGDAKLEITSTRPGTPIVVSSSVNTGRSTTIANSQDAGEIIVNSPLEFKTGQAFIYRNNMELADIEIISVTQFTDVDTVVRAKLAFFSTPPQASEFFRPGDILFQSSFQLKIAPSNYYADTLEDSNHIDIIAKALNGFMIKNTHTSAVPATPYIKLFF